MTTFLKLKVLPKPVIKGKMDVRFPARVVANEFITVEKASGTYTIGADYTLLGQGTPTALSTSFIAILDQAAGIYKMVPLSSVGGAPGGSSGQIQINSSGFFGGITTGTSVATALGVNIGSAGAFVVNGGALGTPSSGTLTNATGLPLSGLNTQAAFTFVGNNTSGSAIPTAVNVAALTAKASPASTDLVMISDQAASGAWKKVTVSSLASAGSVASIAGNTGAFTLANGIGNTGNQIELTAARRTLPTFQTLTSGSGATYTTPANALWLEVYIVGGGGGGGGGGTAANPGGTGGAGGTTSFNSITAIGGAGGQGAGAALGAPGSGGSGGVGTIIDRIGGEDGAYGAFTNGGTAISGDGGSTYYGGGAGGNGVAGKTNSGGGGSGGISGAASSYGGGGGGGGEFARFIINSPAATYTYTVGTAGTAGTAGASGGGFAGGAGAAGRITVIEHYGT